MSRITLPAVVLCTLGLALTVAQANAGTKSANAATPAISNGAGEAATPAMPNNPTAREKVIANRANAQTKRDAAALKRADGTAHADLGLAHHPDVSHPDVGRPEISHPQINR